MFARDLPVFCPEGSGEARGKAEKLTGTATRADWDPAGRRGCPST